MNRKQRIGRFLSSLDKGTESTVLEAKIVVLGSENGTCKNIGSTTCNTKNSFDCYNVGVYCGKKNSQKLKQGRS